MIPHFYTNAVATEHYLGIRWPVAIWRAVMERAVRDALDGPSEFEMRQMSGDERSAFRVDVRVDALNWFADDATGPRSFMWVCDILNIEPTAVRRAIEKRMV